ncbi:MAG TPA: hypothetical protein DCL48_11110 [Alphaproteobacteria bacterium]|nr:hypothetical protein [Alphaproteobacteria bacterium]
MAQSTLGGFIIGFAVGAVAVAYGPQLYEQYGKGVIAPSEPEKVRIEVPPDHTPGVWRRKAAFDIEFSQKKADGNDWDWPLTSPELQLCIREGTEYRKCWGPTDPALKGCQGKFKCSTGPLNVPDVAFEVELYEFDDYNDPDRIGSVSCDIGRSCEFPLGRVTITNAGN